MKNVKKLTAFMLAGAMIFGASANVALADDSVSRTAVTIENSVDSLTIQPGTTTSKLNFNWYAPKGTTKALIKFGGKTYEANKSELHKPTELVDEKYTDSGKISCSATVKSIKSGKKYTYSISNDGGETWSEDYTYTAPKKDNFNFVFIGDAQIREDGEHDDRGWNSLDGSNQTGWAAMVDSIQKTGTSLIVSAGDQVEDQSWGKTSEYSAFFAPEGLTNIAFAPAVGNHDRHYMFEDHFNIPNEMETSKTDTDKANVLTEVKTSFRGQNSGTSQSHGNYFKATADEIASNTAVNGVAPNAEGYYDYTERREVETKANYYYLYNNILFVTLNTGAYPGGNDPEDGIDKDNSEAEALVTNYRKTLKAATKKYKGKYKWLIVTHHKSTESVAKHTCDSDVENYYDAGFEKLMDEFDVDLCLAGHDHVYARSAVLKDGKVTSTSKNKFKNPDGTIYITGNCSSDMQYYTPFEKLDKNNNSDYTTLQNGESGSEAYLKGKDAADGSEYLPYGNLVYSQDYSPAYVLFKVKGNKLNAKTLELDGDSSNPITKAVDKFTITKTK